MPISHVKNAKPTGPNPSSATLAQQIDKIAPADLFISADSEWMDWLVSRKHMAPDAPVTLLGNTLVLIAPAGSASPTVSKPPFIARTKLDQSGSVTVRSYDCTIKLFKTVMLSRVLVIPSHSALICE